MKTAIVTGASRGIGRGIAEHLLGQGWRVIGVARSQCDLVHEHFRYHRRNVYSVTGATGLIEGPVDALINCAAVTAATSGLQAYTVAEQIMETSFIGTLSFSQEAARSMVEGGRIVNFTSMAVPWNLKGDHAYTASKAAVESLTRTMAKELGPQCITVNAVGPCVVDTAMTQAMPPEVVESLVKRQAVPRRATIADVCNVVDFFLSPASAMVTGQVVYLGGVF